MTNKPVRGDMVRVKAGELYHFGVYVSDEEVIQFGPIPSRRASMPDSQLKVLSSNMDDFLEGGALEVAEFDWREKLTHRNADEAVDFARSRIGMGGYHILYNNCEHFAYECVTGQRVCHQTDDLRAMFRRLPVVDVYLAAMPDRPMGDPVACQLRRQEIDGVTNPRVKLEKYYVWKLLGYGLQRSFGLNIDTLDFQKDEFGRYVTEKAHFSLSHSHGLLAVAVSRGEVGVDVEPVDANLSESMALRIMTQPELQEYEAKPDEEKQKERVRIWTAKEALFKASAAACFDPLKQDTMEGVWRSFDTEVNGKGYIFSVATATPEKIRIYKDIKL